jgi:hypothetical protein
VSVNYQGIVFPARAEDLRKQLFSSYRVFLEYWDGLSHKLRFKYEELALSRRTTGLLIYAEQGSGKTLFADKLRQGLERAKADPGSDGDRTNLWHRITGGSNLNKSLINAATQVTHIFYIEDDENWAEKLEEWFFHRAINEHCLVVADNAERGYFLKGLLKLDDAEFMRLGRSTEAYKLAAERFVSLARTKVRPALFVFLTNSEEFALNFVSEVNGQHNGLVDLEIMPGPSERDKETTVRVNVNILNPVTYWYCLDRAGPDRKKQVRDVIAANRTFPELFSSVNEALRTSDRTGRPANKCVLSLAVFTDRNRDLYPLADVGALVGNRTFTDHSLQVYFYDQGWAAGVEGMDARQAAMLESEWSLRLVLFDNRCLAALLLDGEPRSGFAQILDRLAVIHGVGTHQSTFQSHALDLVRLVDRLPHDWDEGVVEEFWKKGQVRSHEYEAALKSIRPTYNTTDLGFLSYRPDLVIRPYRICSVMDAVSDSREAINEALKRDAHVFEFTAIRKLTTESIRKYLALKLPNYARVLEEQ